MRIASQWLPTIGLVVAWGWAVVAGGGGLLLLIQKGPLPLTNGWFALFSGIAACPATAWLCEKNFSITLSGRVRFAVAALFFIAGRIALVIQARM